MVQESQEFRFSTTAEHGEVSAILDRSDRCRSLMVLGHGSGSNMHVPFIAGLSDALVAAGVATFRYEFPYSERDDFVPFSDLEMDAPEVLLATVRSAVATAAASAPDLPLFAGGHSVSGLMTSMADSEAALPSLRGLVLLGFPLKGELKGDMEQAAHFSEVTHPMLFLQGTEDPLGDADQIRQVVGGIATDSALHFVESAGHGFSVPGRPDQEVHVELARTVADWTAKLI
jgi:predicted alpha/beta-hydrolase family hydrolase